MSEPTISKHEIAILPLLARVAFAARCARRVLPLFKHACHDAPEDQFQAITRAICVAERADATAAFDIASAADAAADALATVRSCAKAVARAAAYAAYATDATTYSADYVAYATSIAVCEAQSAAKSFSLDISREFRIDFDHILKIATQQKWDHSTPVPPDVFGPLWPSLMSSEEVSSERSQAAKVEEPQLTSETPALQSLWERLRGFPTVDDVTGGQVHERTRWLLLPNEKRVISAESQDRLEPVLELRWDQPKVFLNGSRKDQGLWCLTASAAEWGLPWCDPPFLSLWPLEHWSPVILATVLNGPLANAYVATHSNDGTIPICVVKQIPLPRLDDEQKSRIVALVRDYFALVTLKESIQMPASLVSTETESIQTGRTAERVLLEIDAVVLRGYKLPPRLERQLLDFFNGQGHRRPVRHAFGDYFPTGFKAAFSLAEFLSEGVQRSTAKSLRARTAATPQVVVDALNAAVDAYSEE